MCYVHGDHSIPSSPDISRRLFEHNSFSRVRSVINRQDHVSAVFRCHSDGRGGVRPQKAVHPHTLGSCPDTGCVHCTSSPVVSPPMYPVSMVTAHEGGHVGVCM